MALKIGKANWLAASVLEAPENERAFWTSIYPKLLPLQVNAKGAGFALLAPTHMLSDEELRAIVARPQLTRDEWVTKYVSE